MGFGVLIRPGYRNPHQWVLDTAWDFSILYAARISSAPLRRLAGPASRTMPERRFIELRNSVAEVDPDFRAP